MAKKPATHIQISSLNIKKHSETKQHKVATRVEESLRIIIFDFTLVTRDKLQNVFECGVFCFVLLIHIY